MKKIKDSLFVFIVYYSVYHQIFMENKRNTNENIRKKAISFLKIIHDITIQSVDITRKENTCIIFVIFNKTKHLKHTL